MSYQVRTQRHLSIINDNTVEYHKRTHAKTCLGALYSSYKYDCKRMLNRFIKEFGLSEEVAMEVIAFGEGKE